VYLISFNVHSFFDRFVQNNSIQNYLGPLNSLMDTLALTRQFASIIVVICLKKHAVSDSSEYCVYNIMDNKRHNGCKSNDII